MNSVDVPSLLRQMQMNMIMPSLLVPQQLGGLPSAAGMLNMNPDIINQEVIRASLGQPALSSPLPNQSATMPNIVQPVAPHHSNGAGSTGLSMQSSPHSQGIASHHSQGMTSEDQVVPASGEDSRRGRPSRRDRRRDSRSSRSRSNRRSSRNHRRHRRESRRSRAVRVASDSESELDVESIRLNATQYLTRDFAKTDNIPSACLMIRKLPRVQLSALIESMHEPWDAALTSNLSVAGLCQLIYLMTITVQPWTRIADLRVEFKYSKLLKRLVNAFNAVKIEQTHWNRVCTMIGNAAALLTEDALNRCALQLGWQPTWMTETQNNTRRTIVPATEYGAIRAFVRPVNNNSEAVGIPLPAFRGSFETEEEGMASNPPARIRRRTIPPRAIIHANQAANVNSEVNPAADPAVVNPPVSPPVDPAVVNPPAPVELVAEPVPAHPEVPEAAAAEVPEAEAPPGPEVPPGLEGAPPDVAAEEIPAVAEVEAPPAVPEEFQPRRPNVELCAFCQCPNVPDEEHGPMVKMNCIHSWHRHCLQEWMDASDLAFEHACPMRCHLGLENV